MKYRVEDILQIKENLAALPALAIGAKGIVNAQEAVALMADVLAGLQKKGYWVDMIGKLLQAHGVTLSLSTLRRYLLRCGSNGAAKRRAKP